MSHDPLCRGNIKLTQMTQVSQHILCALKSNWHFGKLANFKMIDIDFNLKSSIIFRNGWKMYHQVEWVFFIQVLCKQHLMSDIFV